MRLLRILLADDSISVAQFIGQQLAGNGHEMTIVGSGEEAIEAFATDSYDLVLMDLEMPGLGGLEAIRQIRQMRRSSRVPIIVITGHTGDESLLESFMAGADQFIYKPVKALQLEIQIQAMMRVVAEQRSSEALVDNVIEGVVRIDRVGRITGFNKAAERIFGYLTSEVLGQNVKMLMPSPFREEHDQYLGNYAATGQGKVIGTGREVTGLRKDGRTFPMHLGVSEVNSPDGSFFVGLVRDLTYENELKGTLKEGRRFLADLVENSGAATFVKNKQGNYLLVNRKYEEVTGLSRQQVIGKSDYELFGEIQATDYRATDLRVMQTGQVIETEDQLQRDGKTQHFLSIKFPTHSAGGEISGVCGIATEITELKEIQAQLERLSQIDELTGLFNRRYFSAMATAELDRVARHASPLCIVMLDIDHFKRINDTHGHAAGDAVLGAVGRLIQDSRRTYDLAGRLGGEEFALLLPQTDLTQGAQVAERLRSRVAALEVDIGGEVRLQCTLSLGVATRSDKAKTLEQLLHDADQALYQAKHRGRNQVVCWS